MRKIMCGFLIGIWGLLCLSGLALGEGQEQAKILEGAKKEGHLVYYSAMSSHDANTFLKKFNDKYPFIKTELFQATGDKLFNKILMEWQAKKLSADVISTSLNHMHPLKKRGCLMQYWSDETAAYPPNLKDLEGYWTSLYLITHVMGYNTRLVPAGAAPKSYMDILVPSWKGKIAMDMMDAEWFGGQLEIMGEAKGMEYMRKLATQNLIYYSGHNLQMQLLAAGEFPVAVNVYGHGAEQMKAKGAPVEWVPVEPVVTSLHALSISANPSHPNAARLFVDFALSKEGQMIIRSFHRIPARSDVEPDPPRLTKGIKLLPFGPLLAERMKEFNQQYTEIFIKHRREK